MVRSAASGELVVATIADDLIVITAAGKDIIPVRADKLRH
jgi:hypothetical protein